MKLVSLSLTLLLVLALAADRPALAQKSDADLTTTMIKSYDLLEAGKLKEARALYEEVLKEDPANPLALNNLGAILVKEKKYREALKYLEQALPRASGYKVAVNKYCDVEGTCLAFRPFEAVYGNQDLEPLVRRNIESVKAKLEGEKK